MKKFILVILSIWLIFNLSFSVFAIYSSPEPISYYSTNVGIQGSGHAEVDKINVIKNTEEIVIFSAYPNEGVHFVGWSFRGEYEIIEGSLIVPIIKVKPKTDLTGIAIFSDGEYKEPIFNINLSPTSPKTGQNFSYIYFCLSIIIIGIVIFFIVKKKIKNN